VIVCLSRGRCGMRLVMLRLIEVADFLWYIDRLLGNYWSYEQILNSVQLIPRFGGSMGNSLRFRRGQ
jgi:hypothetical protein